jgi:hypothetical protein
VSCFELLKHGIHLYSNWKFWVFRSFWLGWLVLQVFIIIISIICKLFYFFSNLLSYLMFVDVLHFLFIYFIVVDFFVDLKFQNFKVTIDYICWILFYSSMFYKCFVYYKMFQKFQIFPILLFLLFLDIKQKIGMKFEGLKTCFHLMIFIFLENIWNVLKESFEIYLKQLVCLIIFIFPLFKMFQTCFKPYPMFKEISIAILFQPFHYLTCSKSLKELSC